MKPYKNVLLVDTLIGLGCGVVAFLLVKGLACCAGMETAQANTLAWIITVVVGVLAFLISLGVQGGYQND